MTTIAYATESSTLTLNGNLITEMAEGDFITLTPVNPSTSHVNASNGGVNINRRIDADVHDFVVRVQRNGDDDSLLNELERQDTPVVINGSHKVNLQRNGTDVVESWSLQNGSFTTRPTLTYNNTDGNAVTEYTIRFRTAKRDI